jgi:serine protease Do
MGDEDIEIRAKLVGYDSKVDIALLTFEYTKYIDPVDIGDSSKLNKGQLVIAVGNPDGYDYYNSVTFGVVSGPDRYVSTDTDGDNTTDFSAEYIQHDVAINPGNSGGGLFTLDGKLVGINTLKLVDSKIDGMGFAIPSNVVMIIVEDYLEKGIEIVRPKLGIMGYEIRALSSAQIESSTDIISIPDIYNGEKAYGLYVGEVVPGSTIAQTEITVHDIILAINDIKATRTHIINSKLNSLIDGFKVGETVTITYYDRSSNKVKTVDVVLKK